MLAASAAERPPERPARHLLGPLLGRRLQGPFRAHPQVGDPAPRAPRFDRRHPPHGRRPDDRAAERYIIFLSRRADATPVAVPAHPQLQDRGPGAADLGDRRLRARDPLRAAEADEAARQDPRLRRQLAGPGALRDQRRPHPRLLGPLRLHRPAGAHRRRRPAPGDTLDLEGDLRHPGRRRGGHLHHRRGAALAQGDRLLRRGDPLRGDLRRLSVQPHLRRPEHRDGADGAADHQAAGRSCRGPSRSTTWAEACRNPRRSRPCSAS